MGLQSDRSGADRGSPAGEGGLALLRAARPAGEGGPGPAAGRGVDLLWLVPEAEAGNRPVGLHRLNDRTAAWVYPGDEADGLPPVRLSPLATVIYGVSPWQFRNEPDLPPPAAGRPDHPGGSGR